MGWHALTQVKIGNTTYDLPYCHDGWADVLGNDDISGGRYDNTDQLSGTFPFYSDDVSYGTVTLNINENSTFVFYLTSPTNIVLTYNKNNGTKQYAGWYNGNTTQVAYGIIVNDDNQLARLWMFEKGSDFQYIKSGPYADLTALQDLYTDVQGILPSQYNWESVSSITGRLGVINFTRIKEEFINDGSAVTGAPKTNFENLKKANRVSALIDDVLPEPAPSGTDVTVKYKVAPAPSGGTYTYCKLVIKKNKSPNSATDGDKIIDLDPSETSIVVSNLIGETKYYFTIFTKDVNNVEGVSESKHITTGRGITYEFGFTGEIQTFQVPKSGKWKIEAWGAQGGSVPGARGGYGAYSAGEMQLSAGQVLYIGVGGQNGFNGGGNYVEDGNIVNAGIHGSGQALIYNSALWEEDYSVQGSTAAFTLGADALDSLMTATLKEPVLLWEKNDIKLYGVRDATNTTFGGEYGYSYFMRNENDELIMGDPNVGSSYARKFYVFGFDRRENYYNSNVRSRLQHISIAFGIDHDTQQGYATICAKSHNGYYENVDRYYSKYGQTYANNINRAKLYDALIRASS